jgi:NAD(P)-dependent dehydrogenase (short-subunit alcohol dehydrogenase family)
MEQKVAVITGASQGIGAALVKAYRDRDYRVVATARSVKPSSDADVLAVPGDIQVNLLDIELLTIKLRLVIASLDTAREVGINWWESDPWLSAGAQGDARHAELEDENRELRDRVKALESAHRDGGSGG